ncbi:MAG: hypothetical protein WBV18_14150, partial [Methyloceanibacter sp.]
MSFRFLPWRRRKTATPLGLTLIATLIPTVALVPMAFAIFVGLPGSLLARGPEMAGGIAFPFGPSLAAAGWKA